MKNNPNTYRTASFPRQRLLVMDACRYAKHKHMIHGFIEVDVTRPRRYIREHKTRTGESFSFTAFLIYCLARAIDQHKAVHAYRNWRNQLVIFEDVDVETIVERQVRGEPLGTVHIVRAANRKSLLEIHREIRTVQTQELQLREHPGWVLYLFLPAFIRSRLWRIMARFPHFIKNNVGTAMVTAVGMFGKGGGWGIGLPFHTLNLTVGGISRKPGVVETDAEVRIEPREYLDLTLSFDHDLVDGAPAARFTRCLVQLVENASGLPVDTVSTRSQT